MTGARVPFCRLLAREGGRGDKNPLHPRQADLLSEPGGKPGAEAVGHARLRACSDPAVLASVLRCGSIPASVSAVDGRRGRAAWPFSGSCNVFDKSALRKHRSHLDRFPPSQALRSAADQLSAGWFVGSEGRSFCRRLAREGVRVTKIPSDSAARRARPATGLPCSELREGQAGERTTAAGRVSWSVSGPAGGPGTHLGHGQSRLSEQASARSRRVRASGALSGSRLGFR